MVFLTKPSKKFQYHPGKFEEKAVPDKYSDEQIHTRGEAFVIVKPWPPVSMYLIASHCLSNLDSFLFSLTRVLISSTVK